MPQIEIQHLRYRGDAAKAGRVEFAVADALRTEVADDGRLVLVRSFPLGRIGLADRAASRAAASAWRAIRETARHGGASGAESANCVWFSDHAEARTLLMRELARGRTPFAWFWALAVPDWRREPLERWLDRRLGEAAADASGEAIGALVAEVLSAGCVEALASTILARAAPPILPAPLPAPTSAEPATSEPGEIAGSGVSHLRPIATDAGLRIALALGRSIPAALRAALATVSVRSEFAAFTEALARALVLRAHPALSLSPPRLTAISAAMVQLLRAGELPAFEERHSEAQAEPNGVPPHETRRRDPILSTPADEPQTVASATPAEQPSPIARLLPAKQDPAPSEHQPVELRSAAAGLFLTIAPLIWLGWRTWLGQRPELLLHQPGPRLLRRIAAHHRVRASDPVWDHLPKIDPGDGPPPELEEALALWRAGLDGWLRRKARLRLSDLVLRRGWILPGIETTFVRFPLDSIEIGLRRLALDSDPGWVDWLGHAYRVVYRDRPLIGPHPA